jgi:ADP-ribose pyrophosphatase
MKVNIIHDEIPFDEFFYIRKTRLKFERFDGSMSPEVTRYSFEKTDAVAVLVYHVTKEAYILVNQFRYPMVHHQVHPWMTEIVAGGISDGEDEISAVKREVMEEIGYEPLKLEKIMQFYVSPGILNERVSLYLAEVDESCKANEGGGLKHEDEDIELIWIPRDRALDWIKNQQVGDAKSIIALQWHRMQMLTNK